MSNKTVCCICRSEAVRYAAGYLSEQGLTVTTTPTPDAAHLLLPIPSFPDGAAYLTPILDALPLDITVYGGILDTPLLANCKTVDFLKDAYFLADNAAITAECAIQIVEDKIRLAGSKVLILGWGRIGKCLGKLLEGKSADVTIAARKDSDLAMIQVLGYRSIPIGAADQITSSFQIILNTVPAMVLPDLSAAPDAVILELASVPGMRGEGIINARGLPGKMAPKKSGRLIAETFLRLSHKEEHL